MDRNVFAKMSVPDLQDLMVKCNLHPKNDKALCINTLMDFARSNKISNLEDMQPRNAQQDEPQGACGVDSTFQQADPSQEISTPPVTTHRNSTMPILSGPFENNQPVGMNSLPSNIQQICAGLPNPSGDRGAQSLSSQAVPQDFYNIMSQNQLMIQQLISAMTISQTQSNLAARNAPSNTADDNISHGSPLKLTISLIPQFGGTEDENVMD